MGGDLTSPFPCPFPTSVPLVGGSTHFRLTNFPDFRPPLILFLRPFSWDFPSSLPLSQTYLTNYLLDSLNLVTCIPWYSHQGSKCQILSQGEFSIIRQRELREVDNFADVSLLDFLLPQTLEKQVSLGNQKRRNK